MRRNRATTLAIVILAGLMLAGWAISGQEQAGATVEKFSANIMVQGGGAPAGRSTRLNMDVTHWATQGDLDGFKKILTEGGPNALYKALAGRNVGKVQTTQSYEYPIYLAFSVTTEKGRTIKLITERPVFTKEVVRDQDTLEYIYSYIELNLDAKGKGSGKMLGTAKVFINKEGKVDIDTHGQPQPLINARKV